MGETAKSKKIWGLLEWSVLKGDGIDIGCGPDPVSPNVRKFDVKDGDANEITKYVKERFDFVYSSHCLEHMRRPGEAILEWWKLVKPGGNLFFIVPDEDLYEQGVFPSRFNPDHKATFTISKRQSWSPASINVLDLVRSLPGGELVSLELQDTGYNRHALTFNEPPPLYYWLLVNAYSVCKRSLPDRIKQWMYQLVLRHPFDQTLRFNVSAQIQCIVKKVH